MAHNAGGSLRSGINDEKLAAVWEFRTSPFYSDAERVALEYSIAAASQPNDVTDELFAGIGSINAVYFEIEVGIATRGADARERMAST